MKRLFTLAIIAMIATLTFAQAPVQKMKASDRKIEKVATTAQMQKGMEAKAAFEAKAKAAQETSSSVLRKAAHRPTTAMAKQMNAQKMIPNVQVTRPVQLGQYSMSQFKNKKAVVSVQKVAAPGKVKNFGYSSYVPRMAAPKMESESTEIVAIDAAATYYASDGDWYCVLKDADNNIFYFDIVTNNPAELEIGHEYTLADMDPSYSYLKIGSTKYQYSAATFMPKQGTYGTDYEATATLTSGESYHITYTAPEPQALDVEATTAGVTWYGEPDMDWFINLYNANFEFRFDIANQSEEGLELGHEYTLDDMIADYSWGKNKATGESITYQSVSFKATTGANGTDYAATVVDKKGNTYNVKYTTVAAPEPTENVEIEFTTEETDLVDATASQGIFQIVGAKADTGLEAYIGLYANQVAGEYTYDDLEPMYTAIYLDADDYEGVSCADLTGTVTDLGNGAYKAVFEYLGANGTLYKLTFNYGETGGQGPADVTVTKDEHGIITSVEGGEPKTYTRSTDGTVYTVSSTGVGITTQSGTVTVIEDGDKVYIKDPISRYTQGSWVEGTKNGNMIIIPAGQPLVYNAYYDATVSLRYGVVTAAGTIAEADDYAENFVYAVDGNTWTLQHTAAYGNTAGDAYFMGAIWDDDNALAGGEAETVLTYDPEYVAPSTDLVVLPTGAEVEAWNMSGTSVTSSSQTPFQNQPVNVAFVGDDVYLQGLFEDFPTAWVKGTKSGSTVTFSKFQYIGNYGGSYDMYFIGTDGNDITDATATLSADAQAITFNESLLANAATDRIYYLTWLDNVVISATPAEEPVITDLTATLPYVNTFDTEAEQNEAAIYDANGDGSTFTFAAPSGGDNTTTAARYKYSAANAGNDYVVFPGLSLKAGTSYKVSVDARGYSANYPERFEVVAGTVAKAAELSTIVIEPTDVATGTYETYNASFTPDADGVYYFAIHAISDADQFYLYTDNFSVKENNMAAPAVPANFVVTPDPQADLSATIEFNAPAATLAGDAISENVKCVVKRDGEVIFDNITVPAGEFIQLMDNNIPEPGTYVYSVYATVGELTSDAVSASVYVGEDLPLDVENLEAADLNGKVGLYWDAVTEGAQGGVIIPENVKYNVYPVEMIEFWGMQYPSIDFDNPYMTGVSTTNVEVDFDTNSGEQAYTYFGVTAENAAGETNGAMTAVLTGAPYDMPFHEGLTGQELHYWWGTASDDANYDADGGLYFSTTESSDGDNVSFDFVAKTEGWISMESGKIALNGAENPALSFDYKADAACTLQVKLITPEGEENIGLLPVAASDEYSTAKISLSFYNDQPWVRFVLVGEFDGAANLFVDNVNVMDVISDNLVMTVSAPKSVVAGKSAVVKATVKNEGENVAEGYDVKFYVNGAEAATPLFECPALAFLETAEFEFELETSVFDEAGDVTVKAEVVYAADLKDADNADEVVVEVLAPSATPVASVTAENSAEGVVVAWTVAENSAEEVTEDFESYDEMAIVLDGESMGPWTGWDVDGGKMYGWNSGNWPYSGTYSAFGIYNQAAIFDGELGNGGYNESAQALMFMSVSPSTSTTGKNDDWFVSPELPGVAQTISFMLSELTDDYGNEKYEVLASSTGNTPECFTKVAEGEASMDWTEVSANLPEGTKFFAIRCLSSDAFVMLVDDLKYTAGGATPAGFNVYVDQNLVAALGAEAREYTYAEEISEGNHDFSVTAVYANAESAPVTATLGVATGIQNINAASAVEVYTIDGIRMNNVKNLKAGVYVVNGKKLVIK